MFDFLVLDLRIARVVSELLSLIRRVETLEQRDAPLPSPLPADFAEHFAELAWRSFWDSGASSLPQWPDQYGAVTWRRVGSAIAAEIERLGGIAR